MKEQLLLGAVLSFLGADSCETTKFRPGPLAGNGAFDDCVMSAMYAATCHKFALTKQKYAVNSTERTELSDTPVPRPDHPARVGLAISTRLEVHITPQVSSVVAIGVPPPLCAEAPAVNLPSIGTAVANVKISGEVEYVVGSGGYMADGRSYANWVISESALQIDEFNIANVPASIDDAIKDQIRNTALRAVDKELHNQLFSLANLGQRTADSSIPIYVSGYSPYAAEGICG